MKPCLDCGTDISHRHYNTLRCPTCARARARIASREKQRETRHKERSERPNTNCEKCGVPIPSTSSRNRKYCDLCRRIRIQETGNEANRRYTERHRDRINASRREYYTNNPEAREEKNRRERARINKKLTEDPNYRKHRNTQAREYQRRALLDSKKRAAKNAYALKKYHEKKQDEDWAEKKRINQRAARRKRRASPELRAIDNEKMKERRANRKFVRGRLFSLAIRQNGLCNICKKPLYEKYEENHVDHIIPISKGGTHDESNLQAVHGQCNMNKGTKIITPS